jgi:hypothetical protein
MARTKRVNDEVIAFTPEEEAARDAEEAQAAVEKVAHKAEQVAAAETRSSAIEKLKSLGLNDAEIASITGG